MAIGPGAGAFLYPWLHLFGFPSTVRDGMRGFTAMADPQEVLAARAAGGDRAAFDELAALNRERLHAWIRSQIGPRIRGKVVAEDLLQETHLRALQAIGRFAWKGEDSFYRWLCTIARHLIWSASQKRSADDIRLEVEPPGRDPSPSRRLRREERLVRLERSLAGLRPEEREAIRLSRLEGLKVKEIAERLGRPEPTVKSIIARALRKLRERMGDTESLGLPPGPGPGPEDGIR